VRRGSFSSASRNALEREGCERREENRKKGMKGKQRRKRRGNNNRNYKGEMRDRDGHLPYLWSHCERLLSPEVRVDQLEHVVYELLFFLRGTEGDKKRAVDTGVNIVHKLEKR
jgi:hypothetical protein